MLVHGALDVGVKWKTDDEVVAESVIISWF